MTLFSRLGRSVKHLQLLGSLSLFALLAGGCQSLSITDETASASPKKTGTKTEYSSSLRALAVPAPKPVAEEEAVAQIWPRLREGYQLASLYRDNPRVQKERQWYSKRVASLEIIAERSNPYLHHIVEQLDKNNMPLELALLPVIESGYDPLALSSQRAAGLWQFMPATGRNFKLEQTSWYDGRNDVIRSTDAAIKYLAYLNKMFDGDWLLSLAAYNAGEGTVMRAIKNNRAKGLSTDYWDLSLPPQTQAYIPKLIAVAQIFAEPQAHGLKLPPIADEPFFTKVRLNHELDLKTVARLADVSPEKLTRLNPAFKKEITMGGPGYLLVPAHKAEQLHKGLSQLKPSQTYQWPTYTVRANDNLSGIARRHGISLEQLRELNHLKHDRLKIGQLLKIPATATAARTSPAAPHAARYTVKSGDSLSGIAAHHKVSVAELKQWNKLTSNRIRAGQSLHIKPAATLYTVRSGDSLSTIASRHNVSIKQLKSWNTLDGNLLQPGQKLALYP